MNAVIGCSFCALRFTTAWDAGLLQHLEDLEDLEKSLNFKKLLENLEKSWSFKKKA